MKGLFLTAAIIGSGYALNAQCIAEYDSIRRNEFHVNMLPVTLPFIGAAPDYGTMFQAGYRHYFNNRYVLRTAVSFFPNVNHEHLAGIPEYYGRFGDRNIFKVYESGGGGKTQVSLGLEKIIRIRRVQHGAGLDLFVNHMYSNRGETYFYQPDSISKNPATVVSSRQLIDTMGYFSNDRHLGFGMQVFYSARLKITRHWYLSATLGPSFNFAFVNGTTYDRKRKTEQAGRAMSFNFPNAAYISDVSVCYRF